MKILKYALIGAGGLVVVILGVLAYVAATFDPNLYKPQIIQLVKEKTQRTLKLDGDIRLAFWPSLGANLGRAALSEAKSEKEFLAVENLRVSLKVMPLLAKEVVVDEVVIRGVRANLQRRRDGRMNVDDLLAGDEAKPSQPQQVRFDIDHVEIEDAAVTYRDEAKGAHYAVSGLNVKTGRIAPRVPGRIELSLGAQGTEPRFKLNVALKTQLTFDPDQQFYSLEGLDLEAKGEAAGLTNLAVKASGSIVARLKAGEFATDKLTLAVSGASGKDSLDLKLDAPKLNLAANKATGEKVLIVAKMTGPQSAIAAQLSLPGIEGTGKEFRSSTMNLDLDVKQGEQVVKAKVSSPVTGSVQGQRVNLPQLKANIIASGPDLPGKAISGELAGSASVDGAKSNAQAILAGKVGESAVKARLDVANLAQPRIGFDLELDQLDLDRYIPPKPAASGTESAPQKAEVPFDLSGLRGVRAAGSARIGSFKAQNLKASDVRLDLKAGDGRVDVSPLAANLYQGTLTGSASVNAAPATPTFALRQTLTGVNVGALLRDFANNDTLEGRGNLTLDVASQGNTASGLKRALNGSSAVRLVDGAVKGIDIAGSIRNAKSKLGALRGEHAQAADKSQKTDFSELTATFVIRNGVARNNDLSLKSPLLRVSGEGTIDLGEDRIDYLVKATIVGTTKGQGGRDVGDLRGLTVPVRATGPLAAPSYQLDFGAMATDAAKQQVEKVITERLLGGGGGKKDAGPGGAGKESGSILRDSIKGIFGR